MKKEINSSFFIPQARFRDYPGIGIEEHTKEFEVAFYDSLIYTKEFGYLIEEEDFKHKFSVSPQHSGVPDLDGVIQERLSIAKKLDELGYPSLSFSRKKDWQKVAKKTGIITFEALGPTENVPFLSNIHLIAIPFKSINGEKVILASPIVSKIPEIRLLLGLNRENIKLLEHPKNIVPHEVLPSPFHDEKKLTVLTDWSDYSFGIFNSTKEEPHLFINETSLLIAEYTNKQKELHNFLNSCDIYFRGIHLLPLEESKEVPVNGVDLGEQGILIGNAPKSAEIIEAALNRKVHTLDRSLLQNRIGGNAGLRCIAIPLESWDLDFLLFFSAKFESYLKSKNLNDLDGEKELRSYVRENYKLLWEARKHFKFVYLRKNSIIEPMMGGGENYVE